LALEAPVLPRLFRLLAAADLSTAVAVDFDLTTEGIGLNVDEAVDHMRFTTAPTVAGLHCRHRDRISWRCRRITPAR